MKKYSLLLLLFLCIDITSKAQTKEIQKHTHTYAVRENTRLFLDRYTHADMPDQSPCIIFMFGGGFSGGNRDAGNYIPYFHQLVNFGYQVISIDYRLGLKNIVQQRDTNPENFAKELAQAVYMAVEDLFSATTYIVSQQKQWGINKDMIIINGSSAGAVAVLQAEYEICNQSVLSRKLPDGFRYAGVISFAGAIFAKTPDLESKRMPAPIMLFHGDADNQVPYNKLVYEDYGLYGSHYIAHMLKTNNSPYYYYSVFNGGHELAGTPMKNNVEEIISFLNKWVKGKQPYMLETQVKKAGDNRSLKKDFTISDFIGSRIK